MNALGTLAMCIVTYEPGCKIIKYTVVNIQKRQTKGWLDGQIDKQCFSGQGKLMRNQIHCKISNYH